MNDIRKIAVGPDYKGGAMHYVVGQEILKGTYVVHHIRYDDVQDSFKVWIESSYTKEIVLWKQFVGMPVSIEYNINF
ncbi:hypothetical protein N9Q25_00605 [bacterium]|jgi:hypothetical protein|nr:hypothetical protein [bacterium]